MIALVVFGAIGVGIVLLALAAKVVERRNRRRHARRRGPRLVEEYTKAGYPHRHEVRSDFGERPAGGGPFGQ